MSHFYEDAVVFVAVHVLEEPPLGDRVPRVNTSPL
jgi:hypothetical protein